MAQAGDARPVRAVLRWHDQSGAEREIRLRQGDTAQLGREAGSDILLDDPQVSRHHAVITWRDKGFEISDLGSTNGTTVNGERIGSSRGLRDGDVIRLSSTDLTYHHVQQRAPPPASSLEKTFVVPRTAPQPRLIVSAGPQEGREFPLPPGKTVIGRATARDTWDMALQDRSISRPHAEVEKTEDGVVLTDLGSANGTLLNGQALATPTALKDGDVIVLGETTLLYRGK